ncbi:MAG: DEAD/DEAH box helicase family protein [Phycisphaerae bacterium]|nr:DEAD/DEAH box helicase family protein [Phycisphaerae bacterium]
MARRKREQNEEAELFDIVIKTAPCVPEITRAVDQWREKNYEGITKTTDILLNYWFHTYHRLADGRVFKYHDSQRRAIETLIYLYEIACVRRHKDMLIRYAAANQDLRLLQYDEFGRYCIKMATGSGKTKVMALAVAWQFFNAVAEPRDDYARTFLAIAPNVIVFERLRKDFSNGRIFRADPVIPPELQIYWDFDCYMRSEPERAQSSGALYLTNIQQLYERPDKANDDEPEPMTGVLGPKPPAEQFAVEDFDRRIVARGGPVIVVNDEAHHTHEEKSEWNCCIRRLHADLVEKAGDSARGLAAQLDFTATPRHSKGTLFTWTVFDYALKQAIVDGIVKRPMKGIASGIQEAKSDVASTRYSAYLTAGVERWREYREQLTPLKKKPILFVMMNDTAAADEVGDYLRRKYPDEFGGKRLLIIHTDKSGEVSKRDLDKAREAARNVDSPESEINAIVSVLMLREGWDVENVTVVVGLRPYSSKANILPEQTIGRGLRLMFRGFAADYVERVDVIGNKAFIQFVEQLEKEEDIELDSFEIGKDKLQIVTIMPDPQKLEKDIALPTLSPILSRKKTLADEIASLDVASMACPVLPRTPNDAAAQTFRYEGYDIITLQKLIERDYRLPEAQTSQEVISYYAKRIAQNVKLPSQFAALVPKVREFLEKQAFGESVSLDDPVILRAINSNVAQYVTVQVFAKALRPLAVEQLHPELVHPGRLLSETPAFPYSRPTLKASKTVFNLVACANQFEKAFATFLEDAPDVLAFAKLPQQFGFAIEYADTRNNLRYYEPDFVAVTTDGKRYLLETKGREDVDVACKDRAAILWCENTTRLTGNHWDYVKVPEKECKDLQPASFADLLTLVEDN